MSPGLERWVSGASDPGAVVASIGRHPEKVPAEFDERLKWADSDGSLQVMVSLVSRDDNIESLVAANTVDLSWYGDDPRFLARITPDQLITLLESPVVMFVEPDYPITNFMSASSVDVRARTPNANGVYTFDDSTDPMGRIISNVAGLAAEDVTGTGVRVAITDSGIDKTHRDFGGWDCEAGPYQPCESRIVKTMAVQHLVDPGFEPSDAIPLPTTEAASGHGTHVAGTIAGNGYYSRDFGADAPRYGGDGYVIGIAPNAELISVKNGDSQSAGLSTQALQWQLDHASEFGIRVSSNSWGCLGGCSFNGNSVVGQIFRDLYGAGVVVVFAAGNDGGGANGAAFSGNAQSPYVLGVASYNDADSRLASSSSRGSSDQPLYDPATWTPESEPVNGTRRPDVAAPGVSIWSAASLTGGTAAGTPRVSIGDVDLGQGPTVEYRLMSGTSMATPHVSGTAAVLAGACPAASSLAIMRAVIAGANPSKVLKTTGPAMAEPFEVGYGGLDVRASLDRLRSQAACGGSGDPDPDPTPTPTPTPTPSPSPTDPGPGGGTTYYFHSASGDNSLDQVDGGATFDTALPTFDDPAIAHDVPGLQNAGAIEVVDPTWRGDLRARATSIGVDFWGEVEPDQALASVHYTVRVLPSGSTSYLELLPAIDVPASDTGIIKIAHTFTSMKTSTTPEVPLDLPAGPLTFTIRGTFTVDDAYTEIWFDAKDFPSGFTASGGAGPTPTPTPTSSPSPTASPSPPPTQPPGGGTRGTYPLEPNDPLFPPEPVFPELFGGQWGMRKIMAPEAWQEDRATGFRIKVAVLDTGLDLDHPDFDCPGKVEVIANNDFIGDGSGPQDGEGHGTHVAGIVGACTNNGTGVVGVAPDSTIMPIQVLDATGSGNVTTTLPGAIRSATDAGAHVITMSLGTLEVNTPIDVLFGEVFPEVEEAIDYAISEGVVITVAAGNASFPLCSYPAIVEDIVCVGSSDNRDLNSYFGNFPVNDDNEDALGAGLLAPGGAGVPDCGVTAENILSTILVEADGCNEGYAGYQGLNGTSMATPHVAGVAALVYDRLGGDRTGANGRSVVEALISTADDLYAPGWDPPSGYGRLNALAAVASIEAGPTAVDTSLLFTDGSAASAQYTDPAHIEARLVDDAGEPISGAELTFELTNDESYSRTLTATTNDEGVGGVDFDVTENPGLYQLTVRYEGRANDYNGSVDATGFQVAREDTALALADNGTGKKRMLIATLTDGDSSTSGIAGRTIEFFSGGTSVGTAVTDTNGSAGFDPPKQYEGKKSTFMAVFAGDDYYRESST